MSFELNNDWSQQLEQELLKPYFQQMLAILDQKYNDGIVYPAKEYIFNALHYTPYKAVKVVILGQDPYHGEGQAHGLSFSVRQGVKTPPSLQNIYKELQSDIGCTIPDHGCLEHWAKQGVLLLNTVLTVEGGNPNSHQRIGWETFTDAVIDALNKRETPVVFILWGNHAQAKAANIRADKHYIIASSHPSPLAARRGFFGSKPFSRTNTFLASIGSAEIDWQIPSQAEATQESFVF
ncbi:uracil-DNA glycosylase [Paenibacillus harenae]|uniref:Uracil-DNA glycosylase n=1 Tax=Paenibacillus harenae TaxID=306543 RepID=A0ABT9U1N7_PAEHA|nr:uracil-DNA glycosylase [Paenibacillus harenae]MDQ0059498.1 uracil-DNA glycosylase [Paenibacillus harenae]MDQ0112913.1 uracil-DNA glycosylase [Paenibacillus harenae]